MIAFVLGNGISRKSIDLHKLKKYGSIYGCNALYREFTPDHLISVDSKMLAEINQNKYQLNNRVYTSSNRSIYKSQGFIHITEPRGWSSGPTALWLASSHNYKKIYILGFDYKGINDCVNNVYADTLNYKKSTETATYYGNWLKQTIHTIKHFNTIEYIRIIDDQQFIPDELIKLDNLIHKNKDDFLKNDGF